MRLTTGSGPDLALIHGWGIGGYVWQPLVDPLSAGCRVHLVDLPGYGLLPDNGDDFTQTARLLVESLPPRVTLCAWSLGASLAMRAALAAPARVAALILIGATPRFTQDEDWPDAQSEQLLDSFSLDAQRQPGQTLQRFATLINQGEAQPRALTRTLLQALRHTATPAATTLQRGLDWLREVDLRPVVSEIALPCLFLHGANDPLNPLPAAEWLTRTLPRARLEVFPAAGHAPFLANGDRFVRHVVDFCRAAAA